jgi:hypothetical protein
MEVSKGWNKIVRMMNVLISERRWVYPSELGNFIVLEGKWMIVGNCSMIPLREVSRNSGIDEDLF